GRRVAEGAGGWSLPARRGAAGARGPRGGWHHGQAAAPALTWPEPGDRPSRHSRGGRSALWEPARARPPPRVGGGSAATGVRPLARCRSSLRRGDVRPYGSVSCRVIPLSPPVPRPLLVLW